jgi:hypothetical protein
MVTNVFTERDCDWSSFNKNQKKLVINGVCEAAAIDVAFIGSQNGIGESNNALEELGVHNIGLIVIEDNTFSTASRMQTLSFNSNKISVIKGQAFSGLKKLKFLSLAYNKITSLGIETFNELIELETLYLSNNNLRSFDFAILHGNMKLNIFSLSNNSLTDFKNSQDFLTLNIEQLTFSNNSLTAFPLANLPDLPNLKKLWIDTNKLAEINIDKIPVKFPKLRVFIFKFNQWDCCNLIKMIKKLKEMLPEIIIDFEQSGNLHDAEFEQVSKCINFHNTFDICIQIIKLENEVKELKMSLNTSENRYHNRTSLESASKKKNFNHTIFFTLIFCLVIWLLLMAFYGIYRIYRK